MKMAITRARKSCRPAIPFYTGNPSPSIGGVEGGGGEVRIQNGMAHLSLYSWATVSEKIANNMLL